MNRSDTCESATVKSARRVMAILELFRDKPYGRTTTEISHELSIPISSTAALLKSLASMGYLAFDPASRTYGVTVRVGFLGSAGWDSLMPERLAASLSEALDGDLCAAIGIRNRTHVQYVHCISPDPSLLPRPISPRDEQRLVDTPMGLSLLAGDDDKAIAMLVRRANAERSETQDAVELDAVMAAIAKARADGVVYGDHLVFRGFSVAAAAIPLGHGQRLAIGIGGRTDSLAPRRKEIVAIIRAIARAFAEPCETTHRASAVWTPARPVPERALPGADAACPASAHPG